MEAKVGKIGKKVTNINSLCARQLLNLERFIFNINPLFRSILVAKKRGLFPIYHKRLKKLSSKTLKLPMLSNVIQISERI